MDGVGTGHCFGLGSKGLRTMRGAAKIDQHPPCLVAEDFHLTTHLEDKPRCSKHGQGRYSRDSLPRPLGLLLFLEGG